MKLAEQLTALAKKIEMDEASKKKEIDELNSKHNGKHKIQGCYSATVF